MRTRLPELAPTEPEPTIGEGEAATPIGRPALPSAYFLSGRFSVV